MDRPQLAPAGLGLTDPGLKLVTMQQRHELVHGQLLLTCEILRSLRLLCLLGLHICTLLALLALLAAAVLCYLLRQTHAHGLARRVVRDLACAVFQGEACCDLLRKLVCPLVLHVLRSLRGWSVVL